MKQPRQSGGILLAVLVMLTIVAMSSVEVGISLADANRRAAEADLLYIGNQYAKAIESYWINSPTGVRQWPTKLEDLVDDHRFPKPKHHLRKLFHDPMAPKKDWGTVTLGMSIVGVYSQADGKPFRKTGFDSKTQAKYADAKNYADWEFVAAGAKVDTSNALQNSIRPGGTWGNAGVNSPSTLNQAPRFNLTPTNPRPLP